MKYSLENYLLALEAKGGRGIEINREREKETELYMYANTINCSAKIKHYRISRESKMAQW